MSVFVQTSDFESGDLLIAFNNLSENKLQEVIDRVEDSTLRDLLGNALHDLFIADYVAGAFTSERFQYIYEPFGRDEDYTQVRSAGIKRMIMLFVYFEYVRHQPIKNRETGPASANPENSVNRSGIQAGLCSRYNEAIDTFCAIQWYCITEPDAEKTYPEFKGIYKTGTSWI